jgi:hypothetical protein
MIEVASELRELPSDEDAVVTIEFVFPFTTAASDEVAVASAVSVCPFTFAVPALTAAPSELDALVTSDCTARDPDERPAPVRVRVVETQTSAASVPKVVRLRVPFAHTAVGIPVIEDAIAASEEPSEDDAVFTIELVLELMIAANDVEAVFVFAFTLAVPAVMADPSELDAVVTSDWSASEPALKPAPVSVRVTLDHTLPGIDAIEVASEVIDDPIDEEAMSVCAFTFVVTPAVAVLVFPLTTAATEVEALWTSVRVASDPELRPAPVSVRVPAAQMSAAIEVPEVSVRVADAQTAAGIAVIEVASEVSELPSELEALFTIVFVFVFTTAASDEVAVASAVSVWPFTLLVSFVIAAPSELDAVVTSDWSASEPELKPAPVSVRVAYVHTCAAVRPPPAVAMLEMVASTLMASCLPIEPGTVSVLDATFQIDAGSEVIEELIVASVAPREVEAVFTMVFVFELMTAASDEVAVATAVSVWPFTLFVPMVIAAPSELDAVVTSDCTARDPDESPAPVSVRVAETQTSAASVPKVVRLRVLFAQTAAGMSAKFDAIDVDAASTVAFVLVLTAEVIPAVAVLVFPLTTAATEVEAFWTSLRVASEPELKPAPVRVRVAYVHTSEAVSPPPADEMLEMVASTLMASCLPIEPGTVSVLDATFQIDAGSEARVEAREVIELPSDDDAISVCAFTFTVPAVIAEPSELDAVVTSLWSASEPEVRPAPVSVRVAEAQMSAAIAVPEVSERVPLPQMSVTSVPKLLSVRPE